MWVTSILFLYPLSPLVHCNISPSRIKVWCEKKIKNLHVHSEEEGEEEEEGGGEADSYCLLRRKYFSSSAAVAFHEQSSDLIDLRLTWREMENMIFG